ncbi:hypothetical protein K469DRAFT_692372 [Zopfia rhizophila CBS 207.26]|uniref:Uncharacterized protein n=1 Tax=Zopfia rhizophila CBS 207.26 TaxID=1314779 RepID=A0A6A6DSE2_9PEZI|nr:hypothetical protein K469DRAFT_692372 [Zopfia rhizophila CBS 207.26]
MYAAREDPWPVRGVGERPEDKVQKASDSIGPRPLSEVLCGAPRRKEWPVNSGESIPDLARCWWNAFIAKALVKLPEEAVEFAEEGHGAVTIACSCNSSGDDSGRRLGGFEAQGEIREVLREAGVISQPVLKYMNSPKCKKPPNAVANAALTMGSLMEVEKW